MIATYKHEFDGSPNLEKASSDNWSYVVGMKNGAVFLCSEVEKCGSFVRLLDARPVVDPTNGLFS